MLKKEFTVSVADLLLRKIIGEKEQIPDDWEKPELFNMSFVYNPQNYMYAKVSKKSRQNKVGADHSSAALLENAVGQD